MPTPPPLPSVPAPAPQAGAPFPASTPLTPAQLAAFRQAQERAGKIRRAIGVAKGDAICAAIFAGSCFLFFGIQLLMSSFDGPGLALGAALTIVAFNSYRGAAGLRQYDLSATRRLALNQLMLAAFLTLYFAYELNAALHGPEAAQQTLEYASVDAQWVTDLNHVVTKGWYLLLIVATLIGQPLMAYYYHSRARLFRAYLEETPPWVIEMLRQQAA